MDAPVYPIRLSTPQQTGNKWAGLQSVAPENMPDLVGAFEEQLCAAVKVPWAIATASGTAALELALRTLGIGAGDPVICPTLTFAATANAILAVGAHPIFAGCEPSSWGLDPNALETILCQSCPLPKAIIVVDLYGMPARWADLQQVADRFGVQLIADAAESMGATLHGRACGSLGTLNAVSFNQNKIMTTFGGGALFGNNQALYQEARVVANQGRQTEPPHESVRAGGNWRMNPLAAAYGSPQLNHLPEWVTARRAIFERYRQALGTMPGVQFQPEPPGALSNRWLTALTIDPILTGTTRDGLAVALQTAGVETRPVFTPLHSQVFFSNYPFYGDALAEQLGETGLCLPSSAHLSEADQQTVIQVAQTKLRAEKILSSVSP